MAVYTHGHHESVLRSHSNRTVENSAAYLRPHLAPTTRLLDVGAGPGTITADFAGLVGRVTATEIDDAALALSRGLVAERGLGNVDFSVEDVHALSFADDSFDVVHAHQVLQHVADPVQALREMRRVTRGPVAILTCDPREVEAFWLSDYAPKVLATGAFPVRQSYGNLYEGNADYELLSAFTGYYAPYYNTMNGFANMRVQWWTMLQAVLTGAKDIDAALNDYTAESNKVF